MNTSSCVSCLTAFLSMHPLHSSATASMWIKCFHTHLLLACPKSQIEICARSFLFGFLGVLRRFKQFNVRECLSPEVLRNFLCLCNDQEKTD